MCSVAELLSECIRHFAHGSNVQLLKFYYKKTVKLQQQWYTYKGWHLCLYIYSNVPAAKSAIQHASKAEGWCKRWGWDLTVSCCLLLTRRRRIRHARVLERPLWLIVGWSLTCQLRRPERSVFRRTFTAVESLTTTHTHTHNFIHLLKRQHNNTTYSWTSQKAKSVDNRFTPTGNIYFLL